MEYIVVSGFVSAKWKGGIDSSTYESCPVFQPIKQHCVDLRHTQTYLKVQDALRVRLARIRYTVTSENRRPMSWC